MEISEIDPSRSPLALRPRLVVSQFDAMCERRYARNPQARHAIVFAAGLGSDVGGNQPVEDVMGLLSEIRSAFAKREAVRAIQEHPVLRAALFRSSKVFDSLGLKDVSEETKHKMTRALLERISQINSSYDQVSTCRFHLTEAIIEFANYQVLVLPPYPEEDPTELRGTQGVSGELKPLLLEVSEKNKGIREMMHGGEKNPTYEDVWNAVLMNYWRSYWWLARIIHQRVDFSAASVA